MDQSPFLHETKATGLPDWFAAVYRAIDGVLGRGEGNMPPGSLATLYRALDGMRDAGGFDAHVSRGGAMVVTLHRLQAMLRDCADPLAVLPLRHDLETMRREWLMEMPVRH